MAFSRPVLLYPSRITIFHRFTPNLVILLYLFIIAGNTVLRSSTWVPLRLATRTNYVNVNRDHEFDNLSWGALTDQAISYAFVTELCRGNYKAYRLL